MNLETALLLVLLLAVCTGGVMGLLASIARGFILAAMVRRTMPTEVVVQRAVRTNRRASTAWAVALPVCGVALLSSAADAHWANSGQMTGIGIFVIGFMAFTRGLGIYNEQGIKADLKIMESRAES